MIKFTHPSGLPQSKSYQRNADGTIESRMIVRSTWWNAEDLTVQCLDELHTVLVELENAASSYITMGELSPSAKLMLSKGQKVRRNGVQRGELIPTVCDVPSKFACFDIDQAHWPNGAKPEEAVRAAIKLSLPEVFHDADVIYQMSSSCLVKNKDTLKCHLFFELTEPRSLKDLKSLNWWPRDHDGKLYIDRALFTLSQPIYTAKPKLKLIQDPFPHNRTTLSKGEKRWVDVPLPIAKVKKRDPLNSQTWAKVARLQSTRAHADLGAFGALEKSCHTVSTTFSERHNALLSQSTWLGRFIAAGRLNEHEVVESLKLAARINGYQEKVGEREIYRVIRDGISYGAGHPLFEDLLPHLSRNEFRRPRRDQETSSHEKSVQVVHLPNERAEFEAPSAEYEINNEVERVFNFSLERDELTQVIKLPTGSGKTRAALKILAKENLNGRTIIFLVPNHKIVQEVKEELAKLSEINPLIIEGQMRLCQLYQERQELRETIEELRSDGVGIPQLCTELKCPFMEKCQVKLRNSAPIEGRFVLGAHALLSHLKDLPKSTLLVIDESPQLVFTERMPLNRLWSLIASPQERSIKSKDVQDKVWSWKVQNYPTLGLLLESLLPLLEEEVKVWMSRSSGYALETNGKRLVKLCEPLKPLAEAVSFHLDEVAAPKAKRGDLIRSIISKSRKAKFCVPRASTLRMAKALIALICGRDSIDLRLVVDGNGQASLEKRTPLKLPDGVKTWILDATPNLDRLKSVAESSQRTMHLVEGDPESLRPQKADGLWFKSNAYRSSRLFCHDGVLTDEALGALNTLTDQLRDELGDLPDHTCVGIGTHKILANLIKTSLSIAKCGGPLKDHDHDSKVHIKSPSTLLIDHPLIGLLTRFEKVIIGHTGRDNSASNRFNACKVMIIIGAPRMDLRSSQADALSLRPELENDELADDYELETKNALRQWIGRLRILRRAHCRIIYAGDVSPPKDLGVKWNLKVSKAGRPKNYLSTELEAMALDILQRGLTLTKRVVIQLGASAKVARGVLSRLRVRPEVFSKVGRHGQIVLAIPQAVKVVKTTELFTGLAETSDIIFGRVKKVISELSYYKDLAKVQINHRARSAVAEVSCDLVLADRQSFGNKHSFENEGWRKGWLSDDTERPIWADVSGPPQPPDPLNLEE